MWMKQGRFIRIETCGALLCLLTPHGIRGRYLMYMDVRIARIMMIVSFYPLLKFYSELMTIFSHFDNFFGK